MNTITRVGLCTIPGTSHELVSQGCIFLFCCVLQTSPLSLQKFLQEIPIGFHFILTAAFLVIFQVLQ